MGRARQIFKYYNKVRALFPGKGSTAKKKMIKEAFKIGFENYGSPRREYTERCTWLLLLCPRVRMDPLNFTLNYSHFM